MLQRMNKWGRKSLIACVVLTATAVSLIGSPEVPGKVMALSGFELPGVESPDVDKRCRFPWPLDDTPNFHCFDIIGVR